MDIVTVENLKLFIIAVLILWSYKKMQYIRTIESKKSTGIITEKISDNNCKDINRDDVSSTKATQHTETIINPQEEFIKKYGAINVKNH